MGWHIEEVARLKRMRFAGQDKVTLAAQDLHRGMLSRSVLRQLLTSSEAEEYDPGVFGAQQRAADNPVGSKAGFLGQGDDFFAAGGYERLFIHVETVADSPRRRFDMGQTMRGIVSDSLLSRNPKAESPKAKKGRNPKAKASPESVRSSLHLCIALCYVAPQ